MKVLREEGTESGEARHRLEEEGCGAWVWGDKRLWSEGREEDTHKKRGNEGHERVERREGTSIKWFDECTAGAVGGKCLS